MAPFIIGFSIVSLSAIYCKFGIKRDESSKIFMGISFVVLFFIMGFRNPLMGTDSIMYNNIFMRIGQQHSIRDAFSASGISAPGYVIFCRVIYKFFPNYQARIIGTSLIILFGIFRYIKKSSKDVYLSIILFMTLTFYVQSFNISRQYMAIAVLLNAFVEWYRNKKSVLGWVLFFVALSIHTTSIVGLAAWILIGNNIDFMDKKQIRKLIVKSILLGMVVIISRTQLLSVFLRMFPMYSNYFGGRALNQFNDQGQGRIIIIIFGYLAIVIYSVFLIRRKSSHLEGRIYAGEQLPVMLFAVIIGILGAAYPTVLRMNIFFTITAISFIPNTFILDGRSNRRILSALTITLTFAFLAIYMIEDKSDVIPYMFFWS
ncbi:EpsG family protein [Clostridium sp. OF10-22XD]|jgi:hypothetical protein|nr:EpsG family protein [Clostridium sp. OF10-22XD]